MAGSPAAASLPGPCGCDEPGLAQADYQQCQPGFSGPLFKVADGDKGPGDNAVVEIPAGKQWVQIDLERVCQIFAIAVWHVQNDNEVFRCVAVQTADDAQFTSNVHILFNNDFANLLGLGAGADEQYYEVANGKLIDARGVRGRYVRCYSNGSNLNALNRYTEVEVWGLPAR